MSCVRPTHGTVVGASRRFAARSPHGERTLVEVARWRGRHQPHHTAFTFLVDGEREGGRLGYGELDCRARCIAAGLQARGAEGERVLLMFHPGLEYVCAVFGCLYAGALAVPMYPPDPLRMQRTLPRLQAIVEDAQAKFIFGSEQLLAAVRGPLGKLCRAETLPLQTMLDAPASDWQPPAADPEQLALVQYTSGSTGSPRGVMLTHANLMHNLAAMHRQDSDGVVGVCWLPPYHDMGFIGGVLLPVYSGRRNVLMSPISFIQRPMRWLQAISRYRGKTSGGPNFAYDLCVRKMRPESCRDLDLSCWTLACIGAEPVRAETLDRFAETFAPYGFRREAFLPAFGLAEAVLRVSTGYWYEPPVVRTFSARALAERRAEEAAEADRKGRRLVGCGRPLPGERIAIVDPKSRRRLGPAEVGEIWVQSPSVAKGYWNRPHETRRSFRARIAGENDGPYLRTGDLGFVYHNELFVAGRLKELIILGGRNYYPQEIERTVCRSHPALKADGGAAFSCDLDGQECLVVVHEARRSKRYDLQDALVEIRRELAEEHDLTPHAVVLIPGGTLPKTSSGKTRRRACRELFLEGRLPVLAEWRAEPADDSGAAARQVADPPRTPTEKALARLWAEVLGVEAIGRDDDFLSMGGHSLHVVQLMGRLGAEFQLELPIRLLFERPTLAALAAAIDRLRHDGAAAGGNGRPRPGPPLSRQATGTGAHPVSDAQQRLWFLEQLAEGRSLALVPVAVPLEGPVEAGLLQTALDRLVRRHEILRTRFLRRDGRIVQQVAPEGRIPLGQVDLSGRSPEARHKALWRRKRALARQGFDLQQAPLARAMLVRLGEQEHVLLAVFHHIICDGWSLEVLLRELIVLYGAAACGRPDGLPELPVQYADYARWQRKRLSGRRLRSGLAYWNRRLAGVRETLELPTDRPRPSRPRYEGRSRCRRLSGSLWRSVEVLAQRHGATPFMVLLAAYHAVLSRYAGCGDFCIGTAVANRVRPELEGLLGCFVNLLPLRVGRWGDRPFSEILARMREAVLEDFAHADVPFEKVVEALDPQRHPGQPPLAQVLLILQNRGPRPEVRGEVRLGEVEVDYASLATFDLALLVEPSGSQPVARLVYNRELFEPRTIDRMLDSYVATLQRLAADPEARAAEWPIPGPRERRQLLAEWNATARELPVAERVDQLIDAEAARSADAPAVVGEADTLTYGELRRRSNQLARYLQQMGVRPDVRVGIHLGRSPETIVSMLAVLKAGGAYVPMDPAYPPQRLALMAEDSALQVLLTEAAVRDGLPRLAARIVSLETARRAIRRQPDDPPDCSARAEDAAYVIYTSGSTGVPKGVMIPHCAVVNLLAAFAERPGMGPQDVALAITTISFDISVLELLLPLTVGGRVVMASRETASDAARLSHVIRRHGVSWLQATPSTYRMLLAAGWRPGRELKLLCGGEPLAPDLAATLIEGGHELWNVYGPTETTVWSTVHRVTETEAAIPIGRPIANTQVYVLDARGSPLPVGVPGELYIGGLGVARGYWDAPELTAERFLPDPCHDVPGRRVYRTGDRVRWRHDGVLEFLGRMDRQVKVRGFRVELGEVEAALSGHPGVAEAAVAVQDDPSGEQHLVAYLVAAGADHVPPERLREFLGGRLPDYMIPSGFVLLPAMPRTPAGKIDRRRLPEADRERLATTARFVAPRTPLEEQMAALWAQVLGVGRVGVHDNFFELGGHSLLATQLFFRFRDEMNADLPLRLLFEQPTVAGLAERIMAARVRQEDPRRMVRLLEQLEHMSEEEARAVLDAPHAATALRKSKDDDPSIVSTAETTPRRKVGHAQQGEHMPELLRRVARLSPARRAVLEKALLEDGRRGGRQARIPARSPREPAVLSFAEQRLWFFDQLQPQHPFYNMPMAARLLGPFDESVFERSLQELVRRHETLRTAFPAVDGRPLRKIAPTAEVGLGRVDLRGLPAQDRERELARRLRREAREPFHLADGPLFRCKLYRLGAEERVVLLAMHHIISDGWSMAVMLRELAVLYDAFRRGRPSPLPPLPIQYADFAAWQRKHVSGEILQREFAYWKRQLGDDPPPLQLPADRPRPAIPSFEGATWPFEIPGELSDGLRRLARRQGTTLFVVLLAAYKVLLSRYARQTDVSVGTAVANRTRAELEQLIGFFVNTLVLRTDLSGNPTFHGLIERIKRVTLRAYAHQELPFEKLVELLDPQRHRNQAPLFQAALVLQNAQLTIPTRSGLRIEPLPIDNGTAKYDLTLFFAEHGRQLTGYAEYQTTLFDEATIERMGSSLRTLLEAAVEDPHRQIGRLPLLEPAQRRQVLFTFNETAGRQPAAECLHHGFQRHARRSPRRVAVRFDGRDYSYGELDREANRVARQLRSRGVGRQSPVAICLPRSAELVIAMLAVLKAGGAYLPIDPDQPPRRLAFFLRDSRAPLLITRQELAGRFANVDAPIVCWEQLAGEAESGHACPRDWVVRPRDLAYVIYTSGSTGRPKGVLVEHRSIVNFVRAQSRLLQIEKESRILQFFSPCFDGSIAETFLALANGACLVIGDPQTYKAADALEKLLEEEHVNVAKFSPSMLQLLRPRRLAELRTVCSAGEPLSAELAGRWALGRRLFNAYGPTEAAVGACMMRFDGPIAFRPPIGRPVANVRVYLLDEHLEPVPVGVPGEIHIGGIGVARAYLNRPELTASRFLPDPFGGRRGARLYRTGDLGRWRPDGTIEFLGRLDDQVKIRGYRIEPGEIAAALQEHPGVKQAAVVARGDRPGAARLVAYVAAGDAPPPPAPEETTALEQKHVGRWRALFKETLRQAAPPSDPTFNTAGWISSRTGRPFSDGEMRTWVRHTVERILALRPRRVLEVGCGTGLILWRVAPQCEFYLGTDLCGESLRPLERILCERDDLRGRVQLIERAADQCQGLDGGPFDLVVLNSVVQYFPGVDYLFRVLEGVHGLVAPGGKVFLGDVRSLPLQGPLACSIELGQADDAIGREELVRRVRARLSRERELLLHPALFSALKARLPRIERAETLLKRGRPDNELVQYRYDVILHLDHAPARPAGRAPDGVGQRHAPAEVGARLRDHSPETLTLRAVANARLATDRLAWKLLQDGDGPATVGRLRAELAEARQAEAVDPEAYWQLAEQTGFSVSIGWAADGEDGRYDVVFRRRRAGEEGGRGAPRAAEAGAAPEGSSALRAASPGGTRGGRPQAMQEAPGGDWSRYANDPLADARSRRLAAELRSHLKRRLPEYMIPAAVVSLPELPRTPQGKLDRRALPAPSGGRPEWSGGYQAPGNEQEALVAGVWEKLLGVSPVGVKDNFFELGGHSMLAVQMVAEIERRGGRRLPLASLFQEATVEHLARLLRQPEICPPESSLVPLRREGTRRPFFAVHPAGGTVFCYRLLAEHLGSDQPVYGLQAVGVDGLRPPQEVAEHMAAHYIAAVRTVQPRGPYRLGGWSLGGNLAFEMARQLREQGERVELLALIDTGAVAPNRQPDQNDFLPLIMDLFPSEDELTLDDLRAMAPKQHLEYFLQRAMQAGIVLPGFAPELGEHVFEVFKANLKAMFYYQPKPYAGRITLFCAEQRPQSIEIARDPLLGWGAWAQGGVQLHPIPGAHADMVREPNVRVLAEQLRRCLEQGEPR